MQGLVRLKVYQQLLDVCRSAAYSQIYQVIRSSWARLQNLRAATVSFGMSANPVRPSAWNNSSPTGRIFMKFHILGFSEDQSIKFKFGQNLARI
jgi:hypothetical protein